jgi:hypothetical protein
MSCKCSEENWLIFKNIQNLRLNTSPGASNTSFILFFPEGASNTGRLLIWEELLL